MLLWNHWSKILGKYESNERALEILDEIFTKIEESNGFSVTYTMPKKVRPTFTIIGCECGVNVCFLLKVTCALLQEEGFFY